LSLIKSISGIRGTIGGKVAENLTPVDILKFTSAYAQIILKQDPKYKKVVIGRDARVSGQMVQQLVSGTLLSLGIDVVDLGLSTTPTVEMAVVAEQAAGGIILTASHNPEQWNALKLLNEKGEFISKQVGEELLEIAEQENIEFASFDELGTYSINETYLEYHIDKILALDLVDAEKVKASNFKVSFDAINSSGGIAIPALLKKLGVENSVPLNDAPTGKFAHTPEPLPQNLTEILDITKAQNCDVGFVVDPDVDRLAIVAEDGSYFGEEYTLVAIADYVLSKTPSATVSNLSSSRALRDVAEKHGCTYFASGVGEVNVVALMKEKGAKIGGEGNGGIIYPTLHAGRDALVGIALFLTFLAEKKMKVSALRKEYTNYFMCKDKIQLSPDLDLNSILDKIEAEYTLIPHSRIDGLKIDFESSWVHLRKSNTEPIIRIYTEANSIEKSKELAHTFKNLIETYS